MSAKPDASTEITFWCNMSTNHTAKEKETQTVQEWTGLKQDDLDTMAQSKVEEAIEEAYQDWLGNILDTGWG